MSLTLFNAMVLQIAQKMLHVSFQLFNAAKMLHSTKSGGCKRFTQVQIKTVDTLFRHSLSSRVYMRCVYVLCVALHYGFAN